MGKTLNFGFPYPDRTSRPCDGDEAMQALAERLQFWLLDFQGDYRRLERRPAVSVSYVPPAGTTQALTASGQSRPYYNTVRVDTAGMVDLGKRADRIVFTSPGVYYMQFTALGATMAGSPFRLTCSASREGPSPAPVPYTSTQAAQAASTGQPHAVQLGLLAWVQQHHLDAGEVYADVQMLAGGPPTAQLTFANLSAFWTNDDFQ